MDFNLQDVADIPEEQDTEDTEEGSEEEEGEVNETTWIPSRSVVVSNYIQLDAINQSFISLSSQYNDFLRMKGFRKPTITVQAYNIECI